jgi:hypothetical protein
MSYHVEVVRLEPAGIRVEIPVEVGTEHHVTTERLWLAKRPREGFCWSP